MVKKAFLIVILSIYSLSLYAEVDLDASLSGLLSLSKNSEDKLTSSGLAKGNLTVKSKGNKYVKSQLTLDFLSYRGVAKVDIAKAWVKFRYPILRATLGKNRITWGEGAAFNAGDVIFDDYIAPSESEAEAIDLTADELKSINRTMALISIPIGKFTFAEAIYLPYDFLSIDELSGALGGTVPEDRELGVHSAGGRFLTKVKGIKVETGYIYNGSISTHKPYLSFNGTLGLDYHLSSSVNIKHEEFSFNNWKESLKLSCGLFYLIDLENDKTLTLRLESMVKPYGVWEVSEIDIEKREYGVLLYPEIFFIPNDEFSLFLRSIISPIDLSSRSTFGVNWKTYQGFSIGSFLSLDLGERDDIYSFENIGGLNLTIMVTHKF